MSDVISRSATSETYVRGGKDVTRKRHNTQSPLQRKRSQCLKEQLSGRHYANRMEQRAAFTSAVKTCKQKFPK